MKTSVCKLAHIISVVDLWKDCELGDSVIQQDSPKQHAIGVSSKRQIQQTTELVE